MDLAEVEGGRGQLDFGVGMLESSAGEPVEDLLQVANGRFDSCAASFVQLVPVGGSEPVLVDLPGVGAGRWWPFGWVAGRGAGLVTALSGGDEPVGSEGGEVGIAVNRPGSDGGSHRT